MGHNCLSGWNRHIRDVKDARDVKDVWMQGMYEWKGCVDSWHAWDRCHRITPNDWWLTHSKLDLYYAVRDSLRQNSNALNIKQGFAISYKNKLTLNMKEAINYSSMHLKCVECCATSQGKSPSMVSFECLVFHEVLRHKNNERESQPIKCWKYVLVVKKVKKKVKQSNRAPNGHWKVINLECMAH